MIKSNMSILFATSFSSASRAALQVLSALGQIYLPRIEFLHVITSFWKDWLSSGFYEKEAAQRLEIWQQKITGLALDPNKIYLRKGDACEHILDLADELLIDLIVLGEKDEVNAHTGRYLTSKTARRVVTKAKQSVWLCKKREVTRILCAVDGSIQSARAFESALTLARQFDALLCVLSVLSRHDFNPLGMEPKEVTREEQRMRKERSEQIKTFVSEYDLSEVSIQYLYPWGLPSRIILDVAEDFDYDLIVVGATGHNRLGQVFMGSTAKRILRYTPCSLLICR